MKDFLPILIGIIWLGYKYYQKNQKKIAEEAKNRTGESYQEPPKVNPIADKSVKSLDDFMTTFFGDQKEEILETAVNQSSKYESVEDNYSEVEAYSGPTTPIDNSQEWINQEKVSVETSTETVHQRTLLNELLNKDIEEGADNKDIMDDFDIEKAIIYNAILNRPYS